MKFRFEFAFALLVSSSVAQNHAPLPSNYKIVLDEPDIQVQRVHYSPHETVPMHDHPAVTTMYVYLNDDKGFTVLHEGHAVPLNRPPAHAGAFRVSPGNLERHSIVNASDTPSDFLRIELKDVPVHTLKAEFRGPEPVPPLTPGRAIVYDNPRLRVERFICPATGSCPIAKPGQNAILIQIPTHPWSPEESRRAFEKAGSDSEQDPVVQPALKPWNFNGDGSAPYQVLRISFPSSK